MVGWIVGCASLSNIIIVPILKLQLVFRRRSITRHVAHGLVTRLLSVDDRVGGEPGKINKFGEFLI